MVENQRHTETRDLLCRVLGRDLIAGDAEAIKALTQKPQLCRILREHTDALTAIMKAGRQGQRSLGVLVDVLMIVESTSARELALKGFQFAVGRANGNLVGIAALGNAAEDGAGVISFTLPAVIQALGGTITEDQLASYGAKLAELANASGSEVYRVIRSGLPAVIEALDGTITEERLGRYGTKLIELLKASGSNASNVLAGLQAVIQSLGGKITEDQLISYGAKLVELAKTSGLRAEFVIQSGLPAVMQVLGGMITEDQLVSYGAKLVELVQTAGSAEMVIRSGLPAIIKAIDGKITEKRLGSYGSKLVELAKASGSNAGIVIAGLEAVIPALGGKITEVQLASYGAKLVESAKAFGIQYGLTAVIEALGGKITEEQLGKIASEASRLSELVFSEDQDFRTPKTEFASRIQKWLTKELPAVIEVNDKSFEVSRIAGDGEWRVKGDKELDPGLYSKVCKVYLDASKRGDAINSLWQMAGLEAPKCEPGSEAEKTAILDGLRTLKGKQLGQAIKALRGVLPGLSGVEIKAPSEDLMPAEKTNELFSAIVRYYRGHIPEWLKRNGIELDGEAKQEVSDFLYSLSGELDKLTNSGERERLTVQLVGTKNVYDAFYDAIGENCIGDYGFALEDPRFQPIRLIDPKTKDHIGIVYALKSEIDGVPAMVLAGVEIRKKYAYSIKPTGKFIEKLIDKLSEVAVENKLTGGVWTTVGPADENRPWSDDGRIGQYDLIRNGVVELGIARSGDNPFKELDESEQIQFPPGFKVRIHRVLRLERQGL